MRSFIKVYGPPLLKALRALEKVAIDLPEVCIMDPLIEQASPMDPDEIRNYFTRISPPISKERCSKIISRSGGRLGEYDFYFEWFSEPTVEQMNMLIEKIDTALTPLGCKYTITTK